MKDYQQRMIDEYFELKTRIRKLEDLLEKWSFGELDFTPETTFDVLKAQLYAMKSYESILAYHALLENISLDEGKRAS